MKRPDTLATLLSETPAAVTAYLPDGVSVSELAKQLTPRSEQAANPYQTPSGFTGLITVGESESNNTIATANSVPLGLDVGEDFAVDVTGSIDVASPSIILTAEDDGSIPLANDTGLVPGASVFAFLSTEIGDGPFGATSGDYDFYRVSAPAGAKITVDIDAQSIGSSLDSVVGIYNSAGILLDFNDDSGGTLDSFLSFTAPTTDDYFVVVRGFGSGFQSDPFDSSSGGGVGSTGTYFVTIGLDEVNEDFFAVDLQPGDIFGANVGGGATHLTFRDPSGSELIGSGQDATFVHPAASPLPGGGNAALSWVVDAAGTYTIAVDGGSGPYDLNLRVFRPELESQQRTDHQILFLDFDGETLDTSIFGLPGQRTLSPLSAFLDGWELDADDESAVIDAIVAAVEENFTDVGLIGNNGDRITDGIDGHYQIEIINSRDHSDPFGFPLDPFGGTNVSRVIVGGTIGELGIGTIAIAESIDVGNFEIEETAVVLLDLLSASAANPNSLNQYALGLGATIIDLIGVGIGNIIAHEAGHFFANWHTDQLNLLANIMDQGGNLDNTVGVGPNRIFEGGAGDDVDVDFGDDLFIPNEGFTGTEDTLNSIAFGLSTGTVDPGMIVVASSPAQNEQRFTQPTDFVIDFIDPYDSATVDASDLSVNGIEADSVSQTDADTLTFHYTFSPVTGEGLQTMVISAGAVARASDGNEVDAFAADFGFDAVLMEVVSTEPSDGSLVEVPFSGLLVNLNEAYDPASVGTDDLLLSQGSVIGFNFVDDDTIEYLFDGILSEGNLTVDMADGALTDVFGNLGLGFATSYDLDFGQVPFPVPLIAKEPLGSLIYDPTVSGTIDAGDTDSFAISMDPGQTITVVVATDSSLQATIELVAVDDDGDVVLESAFAAAPGEDAVLQTATTRARLTDNDLGPQTYVVTVGGAGGTTGAYRAQIILNAAVEDESHDGPANDTLETAQDLEPSFIPLLHAINLAKKGNQPERGAVLGTVEFVPIFVADFESGDNGFTVDNFQGGLWHRSDGRGSQTGHSLTHSFYYGQGEGPDGGGTYETGDSNAGALVSPSITLPDTGSFAVDFNYVLETEDFAGFDLAQLQINDGAGWLTLASYNAVAESDIWIKADPVNISAFAGQTVQFRWFFDTVDPFINSFEGWYIDDVRVLALDSSEADLYSFSLEAGESTTLALTAQNAGRLILELLDADGTVIAEDVGQAQSIVNGSFETGDFTGWTVATSGSPFMDWQVSGEGTGAGFGMAPTDPQDGSFVAWNGFDGDGPMEFSMFQDVTIPADVSWATLEWQDRVQWDMTFGATIGRNYEVQIRDPGTNTVLETLFSFTTGDPLVTPVGDTGWQTHTADLSAFAGSTVRLFFHEEIPEFFTGPAQIEFDDIRLITSQFLPTNVDNVISNFVAPERGTYFARVGGDGGTDYSLLVTRSADFEIEDENNIDLAQEVLSTQAAGRQWMLGHIGDRAVDTIPEEEFLTVFLADFEAGNDGFTTEDIENNLWHRSTGRRSQPGHSRTHSFYFGQGERSRGGGDYDVGLAAGFLVSPSIDLPVSELIVVDFNYVLETEPFADFDLAQLQINAGAGWLKLESYDKVAESDTWITATAVDITGFAGQTIQLRWYFDTVDDILNNFEGWYVDDVRVRAAPILPESDFYQVTLGSGKPLEVETFTPAARSGEFVNDLDPLVRLYDAAGNLVASDDNSASDGRNARLQFKAPKGAEGTYFIEVTSSDATSQDTRGEYFLGIKGNTDSPMVTATARNGDDQHFDRLTSLSFTFNEDVSGSLDILDLALVNTSTGEPVDLATASVTWDSGTNTATWNLSAVTINTGFHMATLVAAGIMDTASNALDGDANGTGGDNFVETLLVAKPGDTNLDGKIDTTDISNILGANTFDNPANWPAVWATGDFDGDGEVTTDDISLILGANTFEKGPYAAMSGPAVDSSLEPVEFSASGVSMALVGDDMLKHNLRAAPVEFSVPDDAGANRVAMRGASSGFLRQTSNASTSLGTGFSTRLDKGLQPLRRPVHHTTTTEVDLAIRDLMDDYLDLARYRYKHLTVGPLEKVDVSDSAWDDALLTVLDDDLLG